MPDPIPAAPAVAAAPTPAPSAPAAAPAPAASPAPAPATPPQEKTSTRLFKALTAAQPSLEEQITPKPKEKKPDAAPAPSAKTETPAAPAAAAPATPAKPAKEIKRRKDEPAAPVADTPPQVPRRQEPAPTPAPASPAPAAQEQSDADFEKSLVDEEQEMLATARAAEKYLGEKYKGHAAKTTAYLKENLKRLQALEKHEYNGKPYDEEDHKAWAAQAQPKINVIDQRAILKREAVEAAKAELHPEIVKERHDRWVDTQEPKFQAERETMKSNLRSYAYPEDLLNVAEQRLKGLTPNSPEHNAVLTQIRTEYALEIEVANQVIDAATSDIAEFKRLTTKNPETGRAIATFDVNNPQHERIVKIVETVCNDFKAAGGAELRKENKWFATREEWAFMNDEVRAGRLPAAELAKWWTFTDKEITDRAFALVKPAVAKQTEERRKGIERYGFTRQLAQPSAAPTAPVPPTPPGAPAAPRSAPPPPNGGTAQPSTGKRLSSLLVN